jgi:hypothetical protein
MRSCQGWGVFSRWDLLVQLSALYSSCRLHVVVRGAFHSACCTGAGPAVSKGLGAVAGYFDRGCVHGLQAPVYRQGRAGGGNAVDTILVPLLAHVGWGLLACGF